MVDRNEQSRDRFLFIDNCVHRHSCPTHTPNHIRQIKIEKEGRFLDVFHTGWDWTIDNGNAIERDIFDSDIRGNRIFTGRNFGEFKSHRIRVLFLEQIAECLWNVYGV